MSAGDWFRALQVPVLPVSVGPALVGGLVGARLQGAADGPVLFLVVASLVVVQVGANIHKGIVESRDLAAAPARPASAFVFDAGAVRRTGAGDRSLLRLMYGAYATGAALGLAVVAATGDWRLLVFGGLGAFLAYSYSGPPLKLSYKGLGEVSTFLAFGPVTFVGAALAQYPDLFGAVPLLPPGDTANPLAFAVLLGCALGAMTAMISFARYFPAADEDRAKGKRTPVVRLGVGRASAVYLVIASVAAACFFVTASSGMVVGQSLCPPRTGPWQVYYYPMVGMVSAAAALAVGLFGSWSFPAGGRRATGAVAMAVVAHVAVSALLALAATDYLCL